MNSKVILFVVKKYQNDNYGNQKKYDFREKDQDIIKPSFLSKNSITRKKMIKKFFIEG